MDMEREKALFANYPFHIYLMVKAAKQALDEGRARIDGGMLIFHAPEITITAPPSTE